MLLVESSITFCTITIIQHNNTNRCHLEKRGYTIKNIYKKLNNTRVPDTVYRVMKHENNMKFKL